MARIKFQGILQRPHRQIGTFALVGPLAIEIGFLRHTVRSRRRNSARPLDPLDLRLRNTLTADRSRELIRVQAFGNFGDRLGRGNFRSGSGSRTHRSFHLLAFNRLGLGRSNNRGFFDNRRLHTRHFDHRLCWRGLHLGRSLN